MSQRTIIVADDDGGIRTVLAQALARAGYDVRTVATAAALWRSVAAGEGDLVVTDVVLPDNNVFDLMPRLKNVRPRLPIIVMSAQNTFMTAIRASELGAYDYLPKPFELAELVATIGRALADITGNAGSMTAMRGGDAEAMPLVGRSAAMQEVFRTLARLMPTELTVLVLGESGTGKELVARALHDFGKRRKGPFIAVNMAAIPRELIESELFGHEKGAFTGAVNRQSGRFEQAAGGTLFLDEIGDMPMEAQTRLLRVLQQGEFMPVGGRSPIRADVRIIAATHKDLRTLIQQGLFREDLYYRLNVVPIRLPPLRERREDIPALANHFLAEAEKEGLPRKFIGEGVGELLSRQEWPGNVRELANLVLRLAALCPDEVIVESVVAAELERDRARDLAKPAGPTVQSSASLLTMTETYLNHYFRDFGESLPPAGLYDRILREVEPPLIGAALAACKGNQLRAADLLGLNRNTLRKKIRELGLEVPRRAI